MIDLLLLFGGFGLLWGIIISSGPYIYILEKLNLYNSPLSCALCTGVHLGWILSLCIGFHPLALATLPIVAEATTRWIQSV